MWTYSLAPLTVCSCSCSESHTCVKHWNMQRAMTKTWDVLVIGSFLMPSPCCPACQSSSQRWGAASPPATSDRMSRARTVEQKQRRARPRLHGVCIIDAHFTTCHIMSRFACVRCIWSSLCRSNNQWRDLRDSHELDTNERVFVPRLRNHVEFVMFCRARRPHCCADSALPI